MMLILINCINVCGCLWKQIIWIIKIRGRKISRNSNYIIWTKPRFWWSTALDVQLKKLLLLSRQSSSPRRSHICKKAPALRIAPNFDKVKIINCARIRKLFVALAAAGGEDGESKAEVDGGGGRGVAGRRGQARRRKVEKHTERPRVQPPPLCPLQYWSQGDCNEMLLWFSISIERGNYLKSYCCHDSLFWLVLSIVLNCE